ncbi:MAG: TRAM domain-containing protein, partial [Clostridia bacterium]|nr:TRAM domain-containing protein [Clostridia bacterium]
MKRPVDSDAAVKKNDELVLTVTDYTVDGAGVAKTKTGFTVFVPSGAVGDECLVHIIKVAKNYAVGKPVRTVSPSPDRVAVDCPAFPSCGGCDFRHVSYESELEFKREWVRQSFLRLAGADVSSEPVLTAGCRRYRNKAIYQFAEIGGRLTAGFYARHSHRVVPCGDCPLHPEAFGKIL